MKLQEIINFEIDNVLIEFKTKFNLNKFKQFYDIQEKIKYAKEHLQLLGEGSSRIVFLLSNRFVLKITNPNNFEAGIAQNKTEVDVFTKSKQNTAVAKIYNIDPNYEWIIMELVRPIKNEKEFEQLSGINWNDYVSIIKIYNIIDEANIEKIIKYFENNIIVFSKFISFDKTGKRKEEYNNKIEDYKRYVNLLQKNDFIRSVIILIEKHEILSVDLVSLYHWGKTADGRVVLLDYGYSEDVWQKHYKDNDNK